MGLSYKEASALGIAQYHPDHQGYRSVHVDREPNDAPKPRDGMNKLERAFFERAYAEFKERIVREPIKLRIGPCTYYTPDFVLFAIHSHSRRASMDAIYEVKGYMRDDAAIKIKACAEQWAPVPCFLVTRVKRQWRVYLVDKQGIQKDYYTPTWLS